MLVPHPQLPRAICDIEKTIVGWALPISRKDEEHWYASYSNSVLNVLYDCSAIGHAYPYGNGGQTRITFKYRNRNSSFNKSNRIILHKGLWKALNVNY